MPLTVDVEERAQGASSQSQCSHTAGVPSHPSLLTSSLQACLVLPRTALQEAPGRELSLGHLPPHPRDWEQPKQLIPVGHIPSSLARLVQPGG